MKTYISFIIFTLHILLGYSQSSPENKLGSWYMFDGTHKVSEKWSVKTGVQLRSFEVTDNINLLFLYTGANYHLNKSILLTLAYCYLDIDRSYALTGETHLYENRPYEQISYKHQLLQLPIYHRLRLEHRFLNYRHDHTILNRVRYRIGTKIKLSKTVFVNLNNEFFANLKDDVFTENRLVGTFGFNLSKTTNIQLGYMNHKLNGLNLHRLQVGLYLKTDFTKKKP